MQLIPNVRLAVKYSMFIFFMTFYTFDGFGQILNVEKTRLKKDSADYFVGNLGLSFTLHNRDSDEVQTNLFIGLTANGDIAYLSEKHSYMLINLINYTALGDDPAVHMGYTHFRTNFFRKSKVSNEVFTQYQYDLGRGLEARWLIGTGFRISFIERETTELIFGPGIMYEYERWESPLEAQDVITANLFKSTNYLSLRKKITEHIDINSIAYYQTGYDNSIRKFRHRLTGDFNVIIEVTKRLSLKTNFNCTFENRPIVPVNKFVYSVINGLSYNF